MKRCTQEHYGMAEYLEKSMKSMSRPREGQSKQHLLNMVKNLVTQLIVMKNSLIIQPVLTTRWIPPKIINAPDS